MQISKYKSSCCGCQERKLGCHGTCEKYKAFIDKNNEWKAKVIKGRNEYSKECQDRQRKIENLKKHHK